MACLIYVGILCVATAKADESRFSRTSSAQFWGNVAYVGAIANRQINEASGLAASRLSADVLWTVNDGGDGPLLDAIGIAGADLGSIRIAGTKNRDWEDVAPFRLNDSSYLLVADTGNNKKKRKFGHIIDAITETFEFFCLDSAGSHLFQPGRKSCIRYLRAASCAADSDRPRLA